MSKKSKRLTPQELSQLKEITYRLERRGLIYRDGTRNGQPVFKTVAGATRIMASITFLTRSEAVAAAHKLRLAGYWVVISNEIFDPYSDAAFAEAYKVASIEQVNRLYDELDSIVDPIGGIVMEIGEAGDDHVPFSNFGHETKMDILHLSTKEGEVVISQDQLASITDAELKWFGISRADLCRCFAEGVKLMQAMKPKPSSSNASSRRGGQLQRQARYSTRSSRHNDSFGPSLRPITMPDGRATARYRHCLSVRAQLRGLLFPVGWHVDALAAAEAEQLGGRSAGQLSNIDEISFHPGPAGVVSGVPESLSSLVSATIRPARRGFRPNKNDRKSANVRHDLLPSSRGPLPHLGSRLRRSFCQGRISSSRSRVRNKGRSVGMLGPTRCTGRLVADAARTSARI